MIAWENGLTKSSGAWLAALTVGVEADPPSRRAIAKTVTADVHGYELMVSDLRPFERRQFDLARDAAMKLDQSSSDPSDPQLAFAVSTVRGFGALNCNLI